MTTDPYIEAARALMAVADPLTTARGARFEAPPTSPKDDHVSTSNGPSNPTLDTTLNERRLTMSQEVRNLELYLKKMTKDLTRAAERITAATERFYLKDDDTS